MVTVTGTPNKITADIKAALRMHGDELGRALLKLTKSKDERVRHVPARAS